MISTNQVLPSLSDGRSFMVQGGALEALRLLPPGSIQCAVTSPPYWGLRDYGIEDQIGLESTPTEFVAKLVSIFSEVHRVLRSDGTLWLNLGDGYTSGNRTWRAPDKKNPARAMSVRPTTPRGLKPKDLLGLPWRLAFALQLSGWYLRSDIIWQKPNAMPESVKDRPSRSHEYVFMLTKSEKYLYDGDAIAERTKAGKKRNKRSVWSINTQPSGVHFAAFPPALVDPCVLASTKPGDWVLDPFFGSGTVGISAHRLGRRFVGIELHPQYIEIARTRLGLASPDIICLGDTNPNANRHSCSRSSGILCREAR